MVESRNTMLSRPAPLILGPRLSSTHASCAHIYSSACAHFQSSPCARYCTFPTRKFKTYTTHHTKKNSNAQNPSHVTIHCPILTRNSIYPRPKSHTLHLTYNTIYRNIDNIFIFYHARDPTLIQKKIQNLHNTPY